MTRKACVDHDEYALSRTVALAREHPAISSVGDPAIDEAAGTCRLEVAFEVSMPNAWRADGRSPSGVRILETVRFDFPRTFPLNPPEISLRPDFGRDLAHIQPWTTTDGRPVPCLYDGRLEELLHRHGMLGIFNQIAIWLGRAAGEALIDPQQGWEPTRRDQLDDYIVANGDALRSLVDRRGGHRFLPYEYVRIPRTEGEPWIHGQLSFESVKVNSQSIKRLFLEPGPRDKSKLMFGKGLAIFVWPGKQPSGAPIVCDRYTPETVWTVGALKDRAVLFGCKEGLHSALAWIATCLSGYTCDMTFSLAIVLSARRPFNLIGTDSRIELCPYYVDISVPGLFPAGDDTPVRPAGHRHEITPALLSRMSGVDQDGLLPPWVLVGAGSLGSKIALHMGRAGLGPSAIVDRGTMSPHNAARHALVPGNDDMQIFWVDAKARMLRDALAGLGQVPIALVSDVAKILNPGPARKEAFPKQTGFVLHTTASLAAREALSLAPNAHLSARVVEAALYSDGALSLVAAEGPDRIPRLGDLIAEFYALCQQDERLRPLVFPNDRDSLERQEIGEGCGSLTMHMSDGRLSLFAAGISEYLLSHAREGFPSDGGEILIGSTDQLGYGITWKSFRLPPPISVTAKNGTEWTVRLHKRAVDKINREVGLYPDRETGGILVGRLSEVTRTFNVVDVFPPPEDSRRASSEFVLGTSGLRRRLDDYSRTTGWALYCLGTWHSHLASSGPSSTDRKTAQAVSLARLTPSVLLIHAPNGFQALIADRASALPR